MRITFVTRKFGNVERNCDVLHITPIRVARPFLDCNHIYIYVLCCNGDFAIKAYYDVVSPFTVLPDQISNINVFHDCKMMVAMLLSG